MALRGRRALPQNGRDAVRRRSGRAHEHAHVSKTLLRESIMRCRGMPAMRDAAVGARHDAAWHDYGPPHEMRVVWHVWWARRI